MRHDRLLWTRPAALAAVATLIGAAATLESHFQSALPAPTGNFPVSVTTLKLSDAARSYEVEVWYPAMEQGAPTAYGTGAPGLRRLLYHRLVRAHAARDVAPAGGIERLPVVVYLAGWGAQRTDNTILSEELASRGFVVAALDDLTYDAPPSSLAAPLDFSSERAFRSTLVLAERRIDYQSRRASALLDALALSAASGPAARFAGRLRLQDVGIVGYSFGGAVALAAANRDPRFTAVADIDGWLFGVRNERARPYLLITDNAPLPSPADIAAADPVHRYESLLTLEDDVAQRAALSADGYAVRVAGATHLDFTDVPSFSPKRWVVPHGLAPRRASSILAHYTSDFFAACLTGRRSALLSAAVRLDPAATLTRTTVRQRERREAAS